MEKNCLTYLIFFILFSYSSNAIVIPFQTINPLLTKNEELLELIKSTSDKYLVDTISRNLIYTNLNIGDNAQTISSFLEMSTKYLCLKDIIINRPYKIGQLINTNFSYSNNYLLKSLFRNKYYNSGISGSRKLEGECCYEALDILSIRTPCGNETLYLMKKKNINDKEEIKQIDLYIIFQELEEFDHRPAIIGLNYYNEFISKLKSIKEINGYDFSFKYKNSLEENGELIIGDLPHIYDSNNYDEKNLRSARIIKEPTIKWSINFDIYLSSKNESKTEYPLDIDINALFYIEEFFITGNQKYFTYIEDNFFQKYINQKICKKHLHNKAYYRENFFYFICNIEDEKKRKEFFDEFPDLILSQREMDYKFVLNAEDLFTIIPDGKRILFNIDFVYNLNKWIIGKPFFKKFQLIFNSDSNLISYYVNPKEININKEENNKGGNGLKIFLIIFFTIIAFALGIIFGRAMCVRYNRKMRANELEDNFTYVADNSINDDNKNDSKNNNSQINNFKSKYYNLN